MGVNAHAGLSMLSDLRQIDLPRYVADNGELVVMESLAHVPFQIARIFTVRAPLEAVRGRHAHRRCSQFLACVSGAVEVECNDGHGIRRFMLDRPGKALLVPPAIWATEIYHQEDSLLVVLCDRGYEPDDYIRDYAEFKAYRTAGVA